MRSLIRFDGAGKRESNLQLNLIITIHYAHSALSSSVTRIAAIGATKCVLSTTTLAIPRWRIEIMDFMMKCMQYHGRESSEL